MLAQREPGADAAGGVVATLGLPDGPALTVRTVTETDVEGLDALFHGLSDDDRCHRFFSLRHPARKFLEQMTRAEDEGGYRLVAVVSGAGDALVAEAGNAILPDGDGEFALELLPPAGEGGGWDATCSAPLLPPRRHVACLTCKPTSCSATPGCLPWSATVAT